MSGHRLAGVLVVLLVVAGACASSGESTDTESADVAACDVVVQRWAEIQQQLLDDLAAVPEDSEPSAGVFTATAQAFAENSRDALAIGCDSTLLSGSAETCELIDELTSDGSAAGAVLDDLKQAC